MDSEVTTPKRNEAVAPVPNCDDVVANIKPAAFVVRSPDHAPFQAVTLTEHEDITAALRRQKDALQGEVSRLRAKVEGARVLAQHWQGMAAESWGEDKRDAALQSCCDELLETLNLEPTTDGR